MKHSALILGFRGNLLLQVNNNYNYFNHFCTAMSSAVGKPLRWGFLGAGKITHEFVSALNTLEKTDHRAVGIASRNFQQAQAFAEKHDIPQYFGSYEQLVHSSEIDVVYIGTVNSCHYEQTKLALEGGKHVLCEKPLCLTGNQACDLVRISRTNKRFLMEGFWTRCFPAYKAFMKDIRHGKIGHVYQVIMTVGNVMSNLDRFRLKELGGGVLMNHGVYGIQLATHILGRPNKISATGSLSPHEGVDLINTFVLSYPDGGQATTICNSLVKMPGEIFAIGTKGTLKLPWPFWAPTVLESAGQENRVFPLPDQKSKAEGVNTTGFVYEAEEVRRCIRAGLLESPEMPLDESVLIYEICDEIRRQLGVTFQEDHNK